MQNKPSCIRGFTAATMFTCLAVTLLPLRAEEPPPAAAAKLPFTVFDGKGSTNNHYVASGWMGNTQSIKMDDGYATNPHSSNTCLRVEYTASGDWGGVVWQDPANDWGEQPGGWNLTGAKKLKFWARGEKGGETVTFKFGLLGSDKKHFDSASGDSGPVKLTKEWQEYSIDLAGKDLTRIKTGFVWTLAGQGSPIVFFLDDIRFE